MASSNSDRCLSIEMLPSKEKYLEWCEEIKVVLNSEGLLWRIEVDIETRRQGIDGSLSKSWELDREKKLDLEALSLIRKHITPEIDREIRHASTAKEAWDMLESMFLQPAVNQKAVEENVSDEDGSYPLDGDKPLFKVSVKKSALTRPFNMNFLQETYSLLPSTNVKATVNFKGKDIKISYYGERKQRGFGRGWRGFARAHKLTEGDELIFEIIRSDETTLHLKVQIVRCATPLEEVETRATVTDQPKRQVIS